MKEVKIMSLKARSVELSEGIKKIFKKIANSQTKPMNQVTRAKAILLASEGKSNKEIEEEIPLSQDKVSKWRCRYIENAEYLKTVEQSKPKELENAVIELLKDIQRPGAPCNFTEEQIIRILEIACRNPVEFGYESSHWSLTQLAAVAVKEGIVDSISPASVHRFLKYRRHTPPQGALLAPQYGKG
jgi:transposase